MKILGLLLLFSLFSGAASAAALPPAAGLIGIGVAAAVRGRVEAVAPGAPAGRILGSGQPVYLNDHVKTGPGGRLQLLLRDQTTFTLGPNSDMVLDTFVYDPATSAGKVSATIAKGVFRFVTGKIARRRPDDMRVALPVGTIGIRGTIVGGSVGDGRAEVVLLGPGPDNNAQERAGGITVGNQHGSVDIDAGGWGTTITAAGPSAPFRLSLDQLNAVLGPLNAQGGATTNGGGEAGRTASATQASGQGAAAGGAVFRGAASTLVAGQPDAASFASQQTGAVSPYSSWSDILAIQSGTGGYNGAGSWTGCTSCGTTNVPISGTYTMQVNVDFGARQFTYVGISMSGAISDSNYKYSAVSYAAAAAAAPASSAIYTLTTADLPVNGSSSGTGDFSGSRILFLKSGSPGGTAGLLLNYSNSSENVKASGSTQAPLGAVIPAG